MNITWLDEYEAKLGMIDPGGWVLMTPKEKMLGYISEVWNKIDSTPICNVANRDDAEFIAASPEMVAKLIAAVQEASDTLEKLAKLRKTVVTDDMQGMVIGAIYDMVGSQAQAALAKLQSGEFGEGE